MKQTCTRCIHFSQPDNGQYWGLSGVCSGNSLLIFDSITGDFADWKMLPCGTPLVKEWYRCEDFNEAQACPELEPAKPQPITNLTQEEA